MSLIDLKPPPPSILCKTIMTNSFRAFGIILFLATCLWQPKSSCGSDPESLVVNLKVIRRDLNGGIDIPAVDKIAHSALLLSTDDPGVGSRKSFVLEYLGDGKVYLTPAELELQSTDERRSTMVIRAYGFDTGTNNPKKFTWKGQLRGVNFKRGDNLSPEGLKLKMEEIVGDAKYHLTEHNCHIVQEALRRSLGLKVD